MVNDITAQLLQQNTFVWPCNLQSLILSNNPIGDIFNYHFSNVQIEQLLLEMKSCEITSLNNVVFNSETIDFSNNFIKAMRNVTFNGIKHLYLRNCNLTLDTVRSFDWKFISEKQVTIEMTTPKDNVTSAFKAPGS